MRSLPEGYRAIVFGATGGIGGAVASRLNSDPRCAGVIPLARTTTPAIDFDDEPGIARTAKALAAQAPIHLMFDATGVLHSARTAPEKALRDLDRDRLLEAFAVNTVGPALLIKHFHRLLPRQGKCVFATLSARVGSIGDNRLGGWYGYRASKAALNMLVRTTAIELARKRPDSVCLALHPGTVATDLSEPFAGGRKTFTPDESARMLLDVIDRTGPAASGSFLAYDGKTIVW